MRTRPALLLLVSISVAVLLKASPSAAGGSRTMTTPSPGASPVALEIDVAANVLHARRCKSADCADTGPSKDVPILLDRSRADASAATIEEIAVGEGKRIARVRIPDVQRKDLAFEALMHGDELVWSGVTGYTHGSEGDRSGDVVVVYDRDAQSKFVLVGETREDTRICGQATTLLTAKGLDPRSMQLRGATLHRIDKKARESASRIVGVARSATARAPLARLLQATGGSAPNARALTDGDMETTWSEQRPGDGHGEFATLRAPSELPIHALVVTIAPSKPKADGAAPRTFFIATDHGLHQVTMPEDAWMKPGQSYELPLPQPVKTTCVALVLDEAYVQGKEAPEVAIAEVTALTKLDLDGATLDDVAKSLGTNRGEEAAALLRRAGNEGLAAVVRAEATLDGRGRALAVDVAASAGTCDGPAGELLTRALVDREVEVKKRALGRIERCGKAAGEALASAVRGADEARRSAAAPLLATVAPQLALDALGEQLGRGAPDARRAVRGAFSRAAASATRDRLFAFLAKKDVPPAFRLDLVRAIGVKLPELRPESDAAIADLLRASPDMPTRYLLTQPLAQLARTPDATPGELTRLSEMAKRDPEWAVRARAVEMSAGIGPLVPTVFAAASDPEPRVREAAMKAIGQNGTAGGPQAAGAAGAALAKDEWTFVRVAAADALGALPESPNVSGALAGALADPSPKVRFAAVSALGKQRATSQAARVRERLEDVKEDVDVRALAAKTLGAMCVQGAADRLTKLAQNALSPASPTDDRVGIAAIEALGTLHPADLEKRLSALRAKNARLPVRRAAERALADAGGCR